MKRYIVISSITLVGVFLIFGAGYFGFQFSTDKGSVIRQMIELDSIPLTVEIANTKEKQQKGLGGRKSLSTDAGMLFDFGASGSLGIWMKGMSFPIDIFWFDESFKIVDIEKNVSPDTYPQVFYPDVSSRYVLETNAGFAEAHLIKKGDKLTFPNL